MPRSPWIELVALAAVALGARAAGAVAPCFEVCHLEQGQPLLLADVRQVWVRRCAAARPGAPEACVLERRDVNGRVLEQVPHARSYDEEAFEDAHLRGHRVVRLGHQAAWTDLARPYTVAPYRARSQVLRLDGGELVCTPAGAGAPAVRRRLGCAPHRVHVFAAGVGPDGKPEDPAGLVAAVATCAEGRGTREVVAICRPPP